ncbi:hypothetical protein IFR05_011197 [Cadophora sp. M221]|nr:hypothetical protein IFR05_011197 [Cadophora sp. M221]
MASNLRYRNNSLGRTVMTIWLGRDVRSQLSAQPLPVNMRLASNNATFSDETGETAIPEGSE